MPAALRRRCVAAPAVMSQLVMGVLLLIYVALGVKSFIDARKARTATADDLDRSRIRDAGSTVLTGRLSRRIEKRRLHDGGGGAVADGFDRHFDLEPRARSRSAARRSSPAQSASSASSTTSSTWRGRPACRPCRPARRRVRSPAGAVGGRPTRFVQLLDVRPVDLEADDLPRDARASLRRRARRGRRTGPSSRSTSRPSPSSNGEYFCDSISALRLL